MRKFYASILVLGLAMTACGLPTNSTDPNTSTKPESTVPASNAPGSEAPQTATAAPIATATTASKPVSDQPKTLNLNNLKTAPAPGVVAGEVAFFVGGGGMGFQVCPGEGIYLDEDGLTFEIMSTVNLYICHPAQGTVQVKVTWPDGKVEDLSVQTEPGQDYFEFKYVPNLDQPRGTYQFSFSGSDWNLATSVEVVEPTSARLFLDKDHNQLIFYRFAPNEKVRLLVLKADVNAGKSTILGWEEFTMDENGGLKLDVDLESDSTSQFVAVGELSGQAKGLQKGYIAFFMGKSPDYYCGPGIEPLGIQPGNQVQVISAGAQLWDSASSQVAQAIPVGTTLRIFQGPFCQEHGFWWIVECLSPAETCDSLSGALEVNEKDAKGPVLQLMP